MYFIKLFQNHSDYEEFVPDGTMLKPNVSHCVNENEVHYNPFKWANEYFTTVARGSGEISFNVWKGMGTDMIKSISYSTDNGETWSAINNTNDKSEHLVITVNVNEGDKVMWKGDATQLGYFNDGYGDAMGSFFSSTCEFDAQGNVMSLLYGDEFKGQTEIKNEYEFAYLFSEYDGQKTCEIVNAKNLSLPATTLTQGCYQGMFFGCTSLTAAPELPARILTQNCYQYMFYNCTSLTVAPELPATTLAFECYYSMFGECTNLTTAPKLPATTLANNCYQSMFGGCTSLTVAPELPATELAQYCYYYMFSTCTSLTVAPELPATTLANDCYSYMFEGCTSLVTVPELSATILKEFCYYSMFYGCTSLTTAPELPATTLAIDCYPDMFHGCTSLTTAPELPATTLTKGCYANMFNGCTSLVNAPELPATTLAQNCYYQMFDGCTSLTTAPELPATTLVGGCYNYMFYGCTNLNYIKAMFTTTPGNSYTYNWVDGVASTGTFVKNSAATWTTTGIHGIPNGWTIQTATE